MTVPRGRRRLTAIKTASRTSWRWIVALVAHPMLTHLHEQIAAAPRLMAREQMHDITWR